MWKALFSLHESIYSAKERKNDMPMEGPMWAQMLASEAPERFEGKQEKPKWVRWRPQKWKKVEIHYVLSNITGPIRSPSPAQPGHGPQSDRESLHENEKKSNEPSSLMGEKTEKILKWHS